MEEKREFKKDEPVVRKGEKNKNNISSQTLDEIEQSKEIENLRRLEAVFFVSGKFLSMQELISLSDLNPIIIRELIEKLQERYENSNSALEIVKKNKLWKMDVKPEYSNIVNKLAGGKSEFGDAEKETLAIIAYKQPIKQSVIVKIRGNKSYDHIKKFYDLGLIKKKKEGHTHILSLSEDFYDYFSVQGNSEENSFDSGEENIFNSPNDSFDAEEEPEEEN